MPENIKLKSSSFLTRVILIALLVYMVITLLNIRAKIQTAEEDLARYQTLVEQQEQTNAQLQSAVSSGTADDELEDIARYKLGLVAPGEKVYYDITN